MSDVRSSYRSYLSHKISFKPQLILDAESYHRFVVLLG